MAKLINCKACNKEIAKGVKKCIHCGKDQRNWVMRHKILSFIGVIVIFSVISSMANGGSGGTETASSTVSSNSEAKAEKIYKINEPVTVSKKAEVVVVNVEEKSKVGDQFISKKVSDGGTFVAIQATIKNISDKPISSFSTPSLSLVDEKGTEYDADIDASSNYAVETDIDNSKILSDLNPGIKVTDVQVFEISKDAYSVGKWFILVDGEEKIQIK